jgi:hypothetical protein
VVLQVLPCEFVRTAVGPCVDSGGGPGVFTPGADHVTIASEADCRAICLALGDCIAYQSEPSLFRISS